MKMSRKILQKGLIFIWGNQNDLTDDRCMLVTSEHAFERDWFIRSHAAFVLKKPAILTVVLSLKEFR